MNRDTTVTIVPSNLQSKFAPKIDQNLVVGLDEKQQELVETDISAGINLLQVYDDERQASTIFRPTTKLKLTFANAYSGVSSYEPFENQLFYTDSIGSVTSCFSLWEGFPQYKEFDFIREDNNILGYTLSSGNTSAHVNFETQSASSYNWQVYISYPYTNLTNLPMEWWGYNTTGSQIVLQHSWVSSDGIPFRILNKKLNGRDIISFICPMDHGLTVGESVELSFSYNGNNLFTVDSLGDESEESDRFIFNIDDIGYVGGVFSNNKKGHFKRVVDPIISAETKSKYYVRKHKILTENYDKVILKAGYELNSFGTKRQPEFDVLTPNGQERISEKEGNQTYTLTFNKDVNIIGLLDNQKRPLSQLFVTIVNKGYFGWMNNPALGNLTNNNGLKFGFEFNRTDRTNGWWANNKVISAEPNIFVDSYNRGGFTFFYNRDLKINDELIGDFCEWNDYEQTERVISSCIHKMKFNPTVFNIGSTFPINPNGYYYKVHHPIKIREFSTYIETAPEQDAFGVPDYSFFSTSESNFRWRDIYTYGFIDELNVGVNYPFMNGAHHPYSEINFKVMPEGFFDYYRVNKIIDQPFTDDCTTV